MAKGKLPLIGITAATLAVSACVQQLWNITYTSLEDYYSEAYDIAEDSNQNIVMLGRTRTQENEDTLFIAKYGSNGSLIWDYTAPNFLNILRPTKDYLAIDSSNRIFFTGVSLEGEQLFGLLNSNGELAWEKHINIEEVSIPLFLDLAVSTNLYLTLTYDQGLAAYDQFGNIAWNFNEHNNDSIGVDLDDYHNHSNLTSTAASPPFTLGEVIASEGDIYFSDGATIYALDESGNIIQQTSASDLESDYIADIAQEGSSIAAITVSTGQATIHILDEHLDVVISHNVALNNPLGEVAFKDEANLCFAINDRNQMTLSTGWLSSEGIQWEHTDIGDFAYRELTSVNASNIGCQVTTAESIEFPNVTTHTRVFSADGNVSDTISIKDFFPAQSLSEGSTVYSAGITGEYDGSVTRATLYKHSVK